jgi:hypothetical protein
LGRKLKNESRAFCSESPTFTAAIIAISPPRLTCRCFANGHAPGQADLGQYASSCSSSRAVATWRAARRRYASVTAATG